MFTCDGRAQGGGSGRKGGERLGEVSRVPVKCPGLQAGVGGWLKQAGWYCVGLRRVGKETMGGLLLRFVSNYPSFMDLIGSRT